MEQNTALLVMDMQVVILSRLPQDSPLVANVAKAIETARSNNIPVIYAAVGFRPGAPEISANNKGFSAAKAMFANISEADMIKIHPALAPQADDIFVTKRRVSAFTGSDLEVVLRAKSINHIVLTGISTSGVVLSTVREAADKDYRITVLADGCADPDQEVHDLLMSKVFTRQADVVNVGEWTV